MCATKLYKTFFLHSVVADLMPSLALVLSRSVKRHGTHFARGGSRPADEKQRMALVREGMVFF